MIEIPEAHVELAGPAHGFVIETIHGKVKVRQNERKTSRLSRMSTEITRAFEDLIMIDNDTWAPTHIRTLCATYTPHDIYSPIWHLKSTVLEKRNGGLIHNSRGELVFHVSNLHADHGHTFYYDAIADMGCFLRSAFEGYKRISDTQATASGIPAYLDFQATLNQFSSPENVLTSPVIDRIPLIGR